VICPVCNNETTGSLFCNVCDIYLPKSSLGTRAGVARRLGALFLDGVAFWVIFGIILLITSLLMAGGVAATGGSQEAGVLMGFAWIATLFWAYIGYVAFVLCFLSKGKTPGKWLVGMRVADKRNGNFPGLGRMFVREILGKWVSSFFLGLGYFWAIFDRDGQTWHDKIAGTVVILEPKMGITIAQEYVQARLAREPRAKTASAAASGTPMAINHNAAQEKKIG
jgi:uncharacterized RDD family membrane protein YckC